MSASADPNLHRPEWDLEMLEPPFRARAMRAAHRAGAEELGATLYEVQPGGAVSPYHVHHGNEELLVVLGGHPTLRTPEGARRLEPGAVVAFPRGKRGAHRVANASEEPVRVLVVSTMRFPEVAEHGDTGAVMAMTGPQSGWAFPPGAEVPFVQNVMAAMEAGAACEHEEHTA